MKFFWLCFFVDANYSGRSVDLNMTPHS